MIDLDKQAASQEEDDVEIFSPAMFTDYAARYAGFLDNAQCQSTHGSFGEL
jgi:hypothetical protein